MIISIRLYLAIVAGKFVGFLIQIFGRGSGQSAPGLIALKIYPRLIRDLSCQIEKKVVVSATNGKTTTSEMIAQILKDNYDKYVHNSSGSNLARGIASALIESADCQGNIDAKFGVFEVDEAEFSNVTADIKPDVIILGNIFRDQLDRYGEIDEIAKKWQATLEKISVKTVLAINADDPSLASIANCFRGNKVFYGIKADNKIDNNNIEHAADSIRCFQCGRILKYKTRMFSHLGDYYCTGCKKSRPRLDIWADNIKLGKKYIDFMFFDNKTIENVKINILGAYNVYNALASLVVSKVWEFNFHNTAKALSKFEPAFGRMEEFVYGKNKFKIILIKNPTGANTAVEILSKIKNKYIISSLNDNIADGTDISWIYDVDFEEIGDVDKIVCMGKRKYDLALRLRYAGIDDGCILIGDDYWQEIEKAGKKTMDDYVYILPTYTAMIELRKILEKRKIVDKI